MKLTKSIYAFFLMVNALKKFKPKHEFKNKRVAIVGAADSAFAEKNGKFIDEFDIVIRINKAPHAWNKNKYEFVGSKFTFLFHSFYENNYSGGGPVDWKLFDKLGIKKVVNPNHSISGYLAHLNYYKRHLSHRKTYILPKSTSNFLKKNLVGFIPTIGLSALTAALQANCKEIYITGFTFFKTPYAKDYRKQLEDMEVNNNHIENQGLHDPNLEFEIFKQILVNSPCKHIHFDKELQKLLKP